MIAHAVFCHFGHFSKYHSLMLRSPLRKLLILLMVIILIDFKTTMISMS